MITRVSEVKRGPTQTACQAMPNFGLQLAKSCRLAAPCRISTSASSPPPCQAPWEGVYIYIYIGFHPSQLVDAVRRAAHVSSSWPPGHCTRCAGRAAHAVHGTRDGTRRCVHSLPQSETTGPPTWRSHTRSSSGEVRIIKVPTLCCSLF